MSNRNVYIGSLMAVIMGLVMLSALAPNRPPNTPITTTGANPEKFSFFYSSNPPQHLRAIEWGELTPGQNISKDVYVTNSDASKSYLLSVTTSRWGPTGVQDYMAFYENATGQILVQQLNMRFTLEVFPNCTGITWFSFDIIVNFMEV